MLTEEKLAAERKFIKEQLVKIITDSVKSYKSALGALQVFCAADEIPVNIPVVVVAENNTGIISFRTRSVSVSPYSDLDDSVLLELPIFDPTASDHFSEAYAHLKESMLKLGRDGMGVKNALTETFKVHSDALANTNFRIKNTSVDRLGSSIEAFINDFLNLYFVYDKVSIVLNAFTVEHEHHPETEIIFDVTRL